MNFGTYNPQEHTMVIFNKDQRHHVFLLLPDATNEEEEIRYSKIQENFIKFAANVEKGNSRLFEREENFYEIERLSFTVRAFYDIWK